MIKIYKEIPELGGNQSKISLKTEEYFRSIFGRKTELRKYLLHKCKLNCELFTFFSLILGFISQMTLYKPRGRRSRPEGLYNVMREIMSVSRFKKANNGLITFLDSNSVELLEPNLIRVR